MSPEEKKADILKKDDKVLDIVIKTPQGNWSTSFNKTTKIQDVINSIISHFGFSNNGNYELRTEKNPDEPLKPERTLVSYHIQDEDVLIFTDLGLAV